MNSNPSIDHLNGRGIAARTLSAILGAPCSSIEGLVSGPGTATSDEVQAEGRPGIFVLNAETVRVLGSDRLTALVRQIRAMRARLWLSDGEFVVPPDVVAVLGADFLLSQNRAGLDLREGAPDPQAIEAQMLEALALTEERLASWQPAARMAMGGNLGIALGAGVQEFKSQQQAARENQQFDWMKQDRQREEDERQALSGTWHEVGKMFGADLKTKAEYLRTKYAENDKAGGYDDGNDVEIEHLPDNTIAYKTKIPDGKGGFTYGERRIATPQEVDSELLRYAHGRLAAINPKYGANFLAHLQKSAADERAAAQKEREIDIAGRKVDVEAQHYADWAEINRGKLAGAAGAASATAGSADATGMPAEISAVYGHYGYKDPNAFTDNIRKRVAADSATAGMNSNVDIQELATKTQQYTAALMSGQIGAGYTVEELYPVALRLAQSELGVKPAAPKLGTDGKPAAGVPGAYLPHADLGKDGRWYSYVLDGNGTTLKLGARPVDPTRFGLKPDAVADAEIKHPNIRAAVKEAYDLSVKNDESGIAEMVRRIGEEKAIALLNAYSRTLPRAAQPAPVAGRPAASPAAAGPYNAPVSVASFAPPANPVEGHILRGVSAGKDGPVFSVIDPATGQVKTVKVDGARNGFGLHKEAIERWTR